MRTTREDVQGITDPLGKGARVYQQIVSERTEADLGRRKYEHDNK